jgi:hypothetical protein
MSRPNPLVLNEHDADTNTGTRLFFRDGSCLSPQCVRVAIEVDRRFTTLFLGVRDTRRLTKWLLDLLLSLEEEGT